MSGGDSYTNKWMSVHEGSALTGGERGSEQPSGRERWGRGGGGWCREERERERDLPAIDLDF